MALKANCLYLLNKDTSYMTGGNEMEKWVCVVCGYVYDPEKGDPDSGIAPGTAFENIPEDWVCPLCGVTKADFEKQ